MKEAKNPLSFASYHGIIIISVDLLSGIFPESKISSNAITLCLPIPFV